MPLFKVSARKQVSLDARMKSLQVSEKDFKESFVRASGPGGQKVNKTSSCVFLRHLPTGLTVKCQRERSQSLNRFLARRMLLDKIERKQQGKVSAEVERIAKIRRQKRRRSRRAKQKMLDDKRYQGVKKKLRAVSSLPLEDE